MTPTMKNWEDKSNTVVVGVSAIEVENPSSEEEELLNGLVSSNFQQEIINGHLQRLMVNMQTLP